METLKRKLQEEHGEEVVQAYIDAIGEEYLKDFEEAYRGKWASDEEFVQDLLENIGYIPEDLPTYIHIDWTATARDIMMDYTEQDGYYFRNL